MGRVVGVLASSLFTERQRQRNIGVGIRRHRERGVQRRLELLVKRMPIRDQIIYALLNQNLCLTRSSDVIVSDAEARTQVKRLS